MAKGADNQGDLFAEAKPLPQGLVYVPEFISAAEEASLLAEIAQLPLKEAQYKEYTAKRRIVSYGAEYDFESNRLLSASPVPEFLLPLREKVAHWLSISPQQFSHALVTEYRPGTALGWHRDAPEFGVVAGVSLGTTCRMRFRPYPPEKSKKEDAFALELEPRSAYVFREAVRWRWQHSIPTTKTLRYSITFRTLA